MPAVCFPWQQINKQVPLSRDSGLRPGSCRARSPGSWYHPPPTAGWTQWGSAAPAPYASSLPDTGPGGEEPNDVLRAWYQLIFILEPAWQHATPDKDEKWRLLTDRFLKEAMHLWMSGRSGWLSWRQTKGDMLVRKHVSSNDDSKQTTGDTDLHVPLQLFEQSGVFIQPHEGFTEACGQRQDPRTDCTPRLHKLPQYVTARHGTKRQGHKINWNEHETVTAPTFRQV